jgi:anthranilate phosphoribosyltransferase
MPITPQEALQRTIEHREIFHDEMVELMRQIMRGEVSPTMTAAILTGLRVKKETVGEIAGAAQVMREFAARVDVPDGRNLSTSSAPAAMARTPSISPPRRCSSRRRPAPKVAKHGNRSVSSKSGSADVLEALGARIELQPAQVARLHRASRHRLHVRADPPSGDEGGCAGAARNGRAHHVQHPRAADQSGRCAEHPDGRVPSGPGRHPGARAAGAGRERALVVWGRDGMDEISLGAGTLVGELRDGKVREYEIHPRTSALPWRQPQPARGRAPSNRRRCCCSALDNKPGPAREIVAAERRCGAVRRRRGESIDDGVLHARIGCWRAVRRTASCWPVRRGRARNSRRRRQ